MKKKPFVLWLKEIDSSKIDLVGGKGASLGEMYQHLQDQGVKVPNGFAITTQAYRYFLDHSQAHDQIRKEMAELEEDKSNLNRVGAAVRMVIKNCRFPPDLRKRILEAYDEMVEKYGKHLSVAVRSSATAEDLADASFAGQHETYLNIKDKEDLLNACKKCFASLFTDRAISYREDKGFGHLDIFLSVIVQKMVRADKASSGVMFSIDTETGFEDVVFITASYGLGESIVKGGVNPDEYYVFKPTLKKGYKAIISKKLGDKRTKTVTSKYHIKNVEVKPEDRTKYALEDQEILQLAKWACKIEEHYGKPMDIEWAKDGNTGELFIVQARPETVYGNKKTDALKTYKLQGKGKVLAKGEPVGSKIGHGKANVILKTENISRFKSGEVLVTDMTDPDWEPIMKEASAIVTDRGGRLSHAAIVSRELGIPCVIGTENATEVLETGQEVTVSCSDGESGKVYQGILNYEAKEINPKDIPETKTKIMMNIGIPERAFSQSQIPNDGVGLAREEFIINSYIGIHPLALVHYDELMRKALEDSEVRRILRKIEEMTAGHPDKEKYFIHKLAYGIAKIGAAFYPHPVIVRFSDFKTNEYADLVGGSLYEPEEANPMLGWRGASRYYDEEFKPAFRLECLAMKKVRDEMGLTNIRPMVPFCRTVEEGKKVIQTMEEFGLKRGNNGLEVYVMCEIPSNIIQAEEFAQIFDGFSIGSNDLTQLSLGLDRDSEAMAQISDERNPTVKRLIERVIQVAKEKGKKIGICGQAPSDFPDFASFLVDCGIDSMSLNADTIAETKKVVAREEKKLEKKSAQKSSGKKSNK